MNSIFLRIYAGMLAVLVLVALLGVGTLHLVNEVRGEHAAIDTQENRVHGRRINRPGSALHHPPARLRRLRRRTDSPCCAPS